MTTPIRVPLETYQHSSYEPDAEFVDGKIETRPLADDSHSAWQGAICEWFRQRAKTGNLRVRPSLRVQVASTRILVPDVAILDRDQPIEPIITHAPIAVFEVLSPEDTMLRLLRKLRDYEAMGIPEIWSVDPETKIFSRFEDGQLVRRRHVQFAFEGIDFITDQVEELIN